MRSGKLSVRRWAKDVSFVCCIVYSCFSLGAAADANGVCFVYLALSRFTIVNIIADVCKKKWRLLRSSLIRYIKVFKDKSTSKGNRYRPYYLLEHMDFLLPFIDDKNIIRKIKHEMIKSPQQQSTPSTPTTTTVVLKKQRPEEQQETILYTNSTPITYSVQTLSSGGGKDSQEAKEVQHQQQDIQQFYNHAGVKIIGEDYITYPTADGQLQIYQTASGSVEELQQQQQEHQQSHDGDHSEIHNDSKQTLTNATIIPIPNVQNVFSNSNPNEASDIYFLLGLLPDFRNLNNDVKRKVKIGMLKLLDDAVSN